MKTFGELKPKDFIYIYEKNTQKNAKTITRYDVIDIKDFTNDVIKISFGEFSKKHVIDYGFFQKTDYKMPYFFTNTKLKCLLSPNLNETIFSEL